VTGLSPVGLLVKYSPNTTGLPAIAAANAASPSSASGRPASARSFSAKRKSKPIAAACAPVNLSTNVAMRARGHGHWPTRLIDSSSISTMRTGRSPASSRGVQR